MKSLKIGAIVAVAAAVISVCAAVDTTSAAELYKNTSPSANDTLGVGTEIEASLKAGTSMLLKDTGGSTNDTCTGSTAKGKIENAGGQSSDPSGKLSALAFTGCTHTTDVLAAGELEIKNIAGTTNGTVASKNAEVTIQSTIFGISCTASTGTGTTLGTLTGAGVGGQATIDINAVINMGTFCSDSTWTGTYLVTSPTGVVVEEPPATELYKNTSPSANDTLGIGTEIEASLKSGTSALLKDTGGSTNDTCTGSTAKGKVESLGNSGTGSSGKLSALAFTGCTHTTDVLAPGELEIKNITGTTNGTIVSKKTEVTVQSTVFGISCRATTGAGTTMGTLTGAGSGEQAVIDINAVINMGAFCSDSTWTGTYLVTNPTGLTVESPPTTELYKNTSPSANDTLGIGTEIEASLKAGTSMLLKDTGGSTNDTCTGSTAKGKIENLGNSAVGPSGKLSSVAFSGCSHTTDVLAAGELEIKSIAGTTNGTVVSKEAKVTVQSTLFGISCTASTGTGTTLGTLTGAGVGGQATIDINAVINMGTFCSDSTLTGTYLVTNPTGLVVEAS